MKKQLLIGLMLLSSILTTNAQWTPNPDGTISFNTFTLSNDNVYNSLINSGGVATINMGFDGAKGYTTFGAHTGNGFKNDILYLRGNDGNIGLGTNSPSSKLHINASTAGDGITLTHPNSGAKIWKLTSGIENLDHHEFSIRNENGTYFVIDGNIGNIGLGTNSPSSKLHINASIAGDGITLTHPNPRAKVWKLTSGIENLDHHEFSIRNENGTYFVIDGNNGNVGIGTTTPTSLLTVAGKIGSREVKVSVADGADFVFHEDYPIKNIEEVEAYVKENKHLPEIASATEMKENGIELGAMNIKLLQKIEELTLYLIEQNKKTKEQSEKIKVLEGENKRINKIEEQNENLTELLKAQQEAIENLKKEINQLKN